MITVCGVYCKEECKAYKTECEGCNELCGKVSWAPFLNLEACPIYTCCKDLGFATCKECEKMPCQLWFDTRDPSLSDEEFDREIKKRVQNLKELSQ